MGEGEARGQRTRVRLSQPPLLLQAHRSPLHSTRSLLKCHNPVFSSPHAPPPLQPALALVPGATCCSHKRPHTCSCACPPPGLHLHSGSARMQQAHGQCLGRGRTGLRALHRPIRAQPVRAGPRLVQRSCLKAGGEPCGVAAAVAVAQASRRKGGWKVRVVGWKGGGVGENRRTKVERKIVFGIKREREKRKGPVHRNRHRHRHRHRLTETHAHAQVNMTGAQ